MDKKTMEMTVAQKLTEKIYQKLPLDGVETDYSGEILRQGDLVRMRGLSLCVRNRMVSDAIIPTIIERFFMTDSSWMPGQYRGEEWIDNEATVLASRLVSRHPDQWEAFALIATIEKIEIASNISELGKRRIVLIYGVKTKADDTEQKTGLYLSGFVSGLKTARSLFVGSCGHTSFSKKLDAIIKKNES